MASKKEIEPRWTRADVARYMGVNFYTTYKMPWLQKLAVRVTLRMTRFDPDAVRAAWKEQLAKRTNGKRK
jgi:hypothetical protein